MHCVACALLGWFQDTPCRHNRGGLEIQLDCDSCGRWVRSGEDIRYQLSWVAVTEVVVLWEGGAQVVLLFLGPMKTLYRVGGSSMLGVVMSRGRRAAPMAA